MPTPSRITHDLLDALHQPDCPVCRLVERDVRQYIDGFFYESLTVVERRAEIRRARGFCPTHGSILAGHSRTLGTAIVHHDVLNDVLRGFPDAAEATPTRLAGGPAQILRRALTPLRKAVAAALHPQHECVLCAHERHQERIVLETLLNGLSDQKLGDQNIPTAFEASDGICLPHLEAALALPSTAAAQRRLINLQGALMRRLHAELALFIHKNNGSYEFVTMGDEAGAPARAARMVSGRTRRS